MRVTDFVAQRFPHVVSLAIVVSSFLRSTWPKVYTRKDAYNYPDLAPKIGGAVPVWDDALNFFLRIQAERQYARIVEIGTMNGQRALALKRLFPSVEVFGLDLNRTIAGMNLSMFDGVRFGRFSPTFFTDNPGGLLVCRGTLNYFSPVELVDFLSLVGKAGYDVAFMEPALPFRARPGSRRGPDCWYHDWPAVMRRAGFSIEHDTTNDKYRFNLSRTETWYANLAVSPQSRALTVAGGQGVRAN